jgi:CRP-like cAMP-binding protein
MGLPTPDELRVSPLLAMLDDRQLHVVGAFLTPETYQSGRSIVREGDVGYVLFIIKSGEAEVSRGAEILRRLAPGDFFGEIAIVSEDGKRTATVTARTDVDVWSMFGTSFRKLQVEYPDVAAALEAVVAERLAQG